MNKKSQDKSGADKVSKQSPGNGGSRGRLSARSASVKQRKYVAGRIAGKNKKQAALDAGFAPSTAKNTKQKIDSKPGVQKLFEELLEDAGVTNPLLAQRIFEGLHAIDTKCFAHLGRVFDREHLVNWSERREMLELVLKLKGLLVEKHEHQGRLTLEQLLAESHGED